MQSRNPNNIRIIDVSHHQKNIDWLKVAADSVRGAFVKATEGIGYIDPLFRRNAEGAAKAGLKVGYYHFAHPDNSPITEAKCFVDAVNSLNAELPYVLDLEKTKGKTAEQLTAFAVAWLTEVHRLTGHRVMIYTGAAFARSYLGKALAKWPLWIAHYGVNQPLKNSTWDKWAVFQYTSSGIVNGISGRVDMNEMDINYLNELIGGKVVEKPVNNPHWAKKDHDELLAAGIINTNHTADLDKPITWGAALSIFNRILKDGPPKPEPDPKPESPKPDPQKTPDAQSKSDAELERYASAASVYFEVGGKNGSGVLLPNGYVLTAGHVVAERPMRIQTKDRAWHNVSLVAVHPEADIALCRIHKGYEGLPSLPISIRGAKSGDKLLSVGHGKQKMWAKETGEVVREKTGDKEWEFDCSVAGESGDSGSAIVNECGEIVGVMVQTASVSVKDAKGNWGIAVGCEAVNVTHPMIREWIKQTIVL